MENYTKLTFLLNESAISSVKFTQKRHFVLKNELE